MSGKSWIHHFLLLLMPLWGSMPVAANQMNAATQEIRLLAPAHNANISYGGLTCVWSTRGIADVEVVRWELRFVPRQRPSLIQVLSIEADALGAHSGLSHHVAQFRRYLRLPGLYRWQVVAILENGQRLSSNPRNLLVGVFEAGQYHGRSASHFELKLSSTHHQNTMGYRQFIRTLNHDEAFQRFADFEFIFHQGQNVKWHVSQRLFFHSQMGIGGGFGADFSLFQNRFFSLNPHLSGEMAWRSEGLQNYANVTTSWRTGLELIVMPSGCVTLQASYLPDHRIRYATADNRLRTFEGRGWEAGIRLVFPHHFLKPVTLLGMPIDFQRLPIEYHFGELEDRHTGTRIKHVRFSLGYVF